MLGSFSVGDVGTDCRTAVFDNSPNVAERPEAACVTRELATVQSDGWTPNCSAALYQWQYVTPFAVPSPPGDQSWILPVLPAPPPALTSSRYGRDYDELTRVGSQTSTERPPDRADVARFYAASSPSYVFNLAARQVAEAQDRPLTH